MDLATIPLIVGFSGLFLILYLFWSIKKESAGTPHMKEIAGYIQQGASTFLKREFKTISYFIVTIGILLFIVLGLQIAVGFVTGALFSMLAIVIGMSAAVRANVRTANAARTSPGKAFLIAFRGGGIMGLSITSFVLIGISSLYLLFGAGPTNTEAVSLLIGFGFGASLSALFAQLGGGIYTKAADIGADLVGKVEAQIPEDDPRNPAVIADQVGDNVGDCAGRGADLFEASADNLVCSMIIGLAFVGPPFNYGWNAVLFPLLIRSVGKIATIMGIFTVRKWKNKDPLTSLNIGLFCTGAVALTLFYMVSTLFMGDIRLFYCLSTGLLSIIVVSLIIEYYTGINRRPVKDIAEASHAGCSAINILTGLSYGLESAAFPMILIAGIMLFTYHVFGGGVYGIFGVVAATLGITEMKGIIMSIDTFGPIVDNANGIAEMSGISKEARESTDALDAAGNVAKAITKGYALTKVVLTSVVILFAYLFEVARLRPDVTLDNLSGIAQYLNVANPNIIAGFLIGATIPFLFSALTIRAVSNAAFRMIEEVRRQFKEIPGLLQGKAKPDYATCVDISTKYSLKQMVPPTLVGLIAPIAVGFTLGVWPLVSFLLGVKIVGALLAVFMFNSGAAWDNAKKLIENEHLPKRTPAISGLTTHAAAVVGDTVGDPLKDTAGPSLHILIKLENILAITLLPLFISFALIQ
jgi:K(+)-stimulated pyrophosphate-energized sodium pump